MSWYRWQTTAGQHRLLLDITLQPKSRRNGLVGLHNSRLKIQLTAAPVDDRANQQLRKFMAEICGVSPACVELISGRHSRQKCLGIQLSEEQLPDALRNI